MKNLNKVLFLIFLVIKSLFLQGKFKTDETVADWKKFTFFAKSSILDIRLGTGCN